MGKDCRSSRAHQRRACLVLFGLALVLGSSAYWFLCGAALDRAEPLRLTVGALLIFLLPGLVAGELVGLRGRSPLATIAMAFAASCTIEIALLAVVLCLGAHIQLWVGLLLGITTLGGCILVVRLTRGRRLAFLVGLVTLPGASASARVVHGLCVLVPLLLGALAYSWGEETADLGGEKFIHMTFVRYYAEMGLVLGDLGIERGLPPPNLVHLWEFLVAAWATCIRIDPLPVFAHARMVIPVLGLAGMYLLTQLVFIDRRKSTLVFAGVLLLCVGQVVLEAANLRWINAVDPSRNVLAFFGTAHHADAAADILLALTAGIFLLFLRQPRPMHAVLLAGILAANFLWHPREFLQAALYLGVLGPTALLLPSLRRRALLLRWVAALALIAGVAVGAAAISGRCAPKASHGYDEWLLKRAALTYAVEPGEVLTVRSLFHFPLHLCLSGTHDPRIITRAEVDTLLDAQWNYDRWLFLAAAAMIVLVLLGGARDRQLAVYHLLFWLLAYCWNFSMLVILALTYSEFFMATPRLLYLISYLAIADAALLAGTALFRGFERACAAGVGAAMVRSGAAAVLAALAIVLVRWGIGAWVRAGHPGLEGVAAGFNVGCLTLLLAVFWCERPRWNAMPALGALRRPLPVALALVLICAVLWPDNAANWRILLARARSADTAETDWVGGSRPLGYSRELLAWARRLPAGNRIASNPLDIAMLSVYTPQYLCVQPVGSVIADKPERDRAEQGKHPFYRPLAPAQARQAWCVEHMEALAWLQQRRADYVLINRDDHDAPVLSYFHAHPEAYEIVFENSGAREAVFRVLAPGVR